METNTPPIDWETDLADLLGDLSDVQQEMLEVLSQKRQCMAAGDAEGMQQLQEREQNVCDSLQKCHQRRGELLELAGRQGLPSDSISKLATTLPEDQRGKLTKQVKQVSSKMRLLQHNSLTNWVVAQRSLIHISQLLEIIASGGRLQPTYAKGESVHSRGALVDREV